jgi:hypothetical protein
MFGGAAMWNNPLKIYQVYLKYTDINKVL